MFYDITLCCLRFERLTRCAQWGKTVRLDGVTTRLAFALSQFGPS